MSNFQNQIIELRRKVDLLQNTNVVFNVEPRNPTTQTIYINDTTGETKFWTGKDWVITAGTGGGLTAWNTSVVFTATDYRTIAWTTGVVSVGTTTSKTDYATTSGNFTMSTTTYFYWQADIPTAIQTTSTAGDVVIAGGILIAVGRLNPDTANSATLKVFGGPSVDLVISDQIVANTITANMIQANTITASKMSVTTLSSLTADLGTITAGTITMNATGYLRGGQTAYNTGTGFFLGYESSLYKFSIGDIDSSLTWDGANLRIKGALELTSIFQNINYTVANLPTPPTIIGFNPPSDYE